jgi:hypothetical protein
MGEWCPPPLASYAIDSHGQLWEHLTRPSCYLFLGLLSAFNGAKVLAVGTAIVIIVAIISSLTSKWKKRQ